MQRSLLALMVVLTVLYGCGEASKPVERIEKQHGIDKQADEQETTAASARLLRGRTRSQRPDTT